MYQSEKRLFWTWPLALPGQCLYPDLLIGGGGQLKGEVGVRLS